MMGIFQKNNPNVGSNQLDSKLLALSKNLRQMGSVAVAFSGGVDSTFLLKVATDTLGKNALAMTVESQLHASYESAESKKLAREVKARHKTIWIDLMQKEEISSNQEDRCYRCKKELFLQISKEAAKENIAHIIEGSNVDDSHDYRPGMKALAELRIKSPLAEAGLTKDEIRVLSSRLGLTTWKKPSFSCLATRFPYGEILTEQKLRQVEEAENILRQKGIGQFRVRYHNNIAKIEVRREDMQKVLDMSDELSAKLKQLGFSYIALDIEGYRQGSLNEVLCNGKDAGRLSR